jgi:hypothetical protein
VRARAIDHRRCRRSRACRCSGRGRAPDFDDLASGSISGGAEGHAAIVIDKLNREVVRILSDPGKTKSSERRLHQTSTPEVHRLHAQGSRAGAALKDLQITTTEERESDEARLLAAIILALLGAPARPRTCSKSPQRGSWRRDPELGRQQTSSEARTSTSLSSHGGRRRTLQAVISDASTSGLSAGGRRRWCVLQNAPIPSSVQARPAA